MAVKYSKTLEKTRKHVENYKHHVRSERYVPIGQTSNTESPRISLTD